jgi:hypothetical protein
MDKVLLDYLVYGALKNGGSWGGPICRIAVPFNIHVTESIFWLMISIIIYNLLHFGLKFKVLIIKMNEENKNIKSNVTIRFIEKSLAALYFLFYTSTIYYKTNLKSLINLIQPCHVLILLQGIALYSDGIIGILITTLILPVLTGALFAVLFPDTSGLDQPFEMELYWVQHYFILLMPIYLLSRKSFIALKCSSWFSILLGLWILLILHFSLYEVLM